MIPAARFSRKNYHCRTSFHGRNAAACADGRVGTLIRMPAIPPPPYPCAAAPPFPRPQASSVFRIFTVFQSGNPHLSNYILRVTAGRQPCGIDCQLNNARTPSLRKTRKDGRFLCLCRLIQYLYGHSAIDIFFFFSFSSSMPLRYGVS